MSSPPEDQAKPSGNAALRAQRVHVVLVNWNGFADTCRCLRALAEMQSLPAQVWVVDNASPDGSGDALERWFIDSPPPALPVQLLRSSHNRGFGGGCNLGIQAAFAAGADSIWLLNNDSVPAADALAALVAQLRSAPEIGAVGALIYDLHRPHRMQVWGGGWVIPFLGLNYHLRRPSADARVDYLTGACMLLDRRALEQVGLFDGQRYFMYWEDVDLSYRLRQGGWTLRVAAQARIWHRHSSSLGHDHPIKDAYVAASVRAFLQQYYPSLQPWSLTIGSGIRMAKRALRGDWENVRAIRVVLRGESYVPRSEEALPSSSPADPPPPLLVAVEIDTLRGKAAGIGHVTRHLIRTLQEQPGVSLRFFSSAGAWAELPQLQPGLGAPRWSQRLKRLAEKIPLGRDIRYLLQYGYLHRLTRREPVDLVLGPNYVLPPSSAPSIVIVHDLSHLRYPEMHPPGRVRFLQRHLRASLSRARSIIAVSNFTKKELLHFFPDLAGRIEVIYPSIDERFHRPVEDEQERALLAALGGEQRRYFLFLSTLEPRKNLRRLLEAYRGLPDEVRAAHPLVLAGQMGWRESSFASLIEELQQRGECILTGYLRDELLPALYHRAQALLYPSLYEGFGLPPVEALACGCPVLVSNVSSMPEVCGDAAVYCDPACVKSIREGIVQLLSSEFRGSSSLCYHGKGAGCRQIVELVQEGAGAVGNRGIFWA